MSYKGISLFKRNIVLLNSWYIGVILPQIVILAQHSLDKNQYFYVFMKKSMYNLVIWSIFHTFAPWDVSLKERNTFLLNNSQCLIVVAVPHSNIIELMMRLLALSTTEVSNEERYICVVFSESCPNASLIAETGTFLLLAMLAHEWRAT